MSNSLTLYKCQIFQLYNFYVLYVLNTSHKLYLYMKLYMVSELSISCLLFTLTPPPRSMCGRYASYWNAFLYCFVFVYGIQCWVTFFQKAIHWPNSFIKISLKFTIFTRDFSLLPLHSWESWIEIGNTWPRSLE